MILRRRQVRESQLAWTIILGYELAARDGELLSQAFEPKPAQPDAPVDKPSLPTVLWIFYTAAHCADLLPAQLDVYRHGGLFVRWAVRRAFNWVTRW